MIETEALGSAQDALAAFVTAVGTEGPVAVIGGRTQWDVGGPPCPGTRLVSAPAGVVEHRPAEMTVRVLAGTTVATLDAALAPSGQMVPLDFDSEATVGGVLSVGRTGLRRLRWGPVRDYVLEARYVGADGLLVRAGAPVVKNVSGFDLVRLLIGSLGTLGCLAEVVLRTVPRPIASQWWTGPGADAERVLAELYRPTCILWNGTRSWVQLEGHPEDVTTQAARLGPEWERGHPPPLPTEGRASVEPGQVQGLAARLPDGSFVAEMGVGVVHLGAAAAGLLPATGADPAADAVNRRIKGSLDPGGRLNPGRRP